MHLHVLNVVMFTLAASGWGGGVEGGETLSFRRKISLSLSSFPPPLSFSPLPEVSGKVCLWLFELQPDLQKVAPQPENLWMKK